MAVNVVTGQGGTNHISSDNARYANAATFGKGKYVLNIGNKFAATVESPNLVRIMDGMAINQGTQIGIDPDDYEDVGIENGVTGMNRNDIIVMRYIRNDSTSIESGVMEVISGESVSGTPTDPAITSGNILDGKELVDDFPLYRVRVRGLTIEGLDTLFTMWDKDLETYSGDMTAALATKVDKSSVQSAVNTSTNPVSSNAVREALASKADTASVRLLSGATAIPANEDLNNYKTPGNYGASSSATAKTIANVPEQTAFGLRVYYATPTSDLSQEFETWAEHHFYHRTFSSGAWRAWEKQPTRSEISTINQQIEEIEAGTLKGALMESVNDALGAKNLLEITADTSTVSGITFAVDKDAGTIFVAGGQTATGAISFTIGKADIVANETYVLSGCPSGGSSSTYWIKSNQDANFVDYGNGVNISFGLSKSIDPGIRMQSGYTTPSGGLLFKPMIRPAAYESATFAPYAKSNRELTLDAAVLPENAKKNFLDFDSFANYANSVVSEAVTANGNNTYTVNMPSLRRATEPAIGGTPWKFSETDEEFTVSLTASPGTGRNLIVAIWNSNNEYVSSVKAADVSNEKLTVSGFGSKLAFSFGNGGTYILKDFMIRPAETSPDYVPYMHSNLELSHMYEGNETYNLLEITVDSQTINGVTFTVDKEAGTVTANGTATANASFNLPLTLPGGSYSLSGCPSGGDATNKYYLYGATVGAFDLGSGAEFEISSSTSFNVCCRVQSGYTANNLVFKPMIRPANTPLDFVPFRKTNEQLTVEMGNQWSLSGGTAIPSGADLNNYTTIGNYYCASSSGASTMTNNPEKSAFTLKVFHSTGVAYPRQELRAYSSGNIYDRFGNTDSGSLVWADWVKRPTRTEVDAKLSQSDVQSQVLANDKPISANAIYKLIRHDTSDHYYIGIVSYQHVIVPMDTTTYNNNYWGQSYGKNVSCSSINLDDGTSMSFNNNILYYKNALLIDLQTPQTTKIGHLAYVTLTGLV